jgi:molybdate transport system substrate-binding protein
MAAGVLALVTLAACTGDAHDDGLTVFAAASLRTVMTQLESAWLAEHPGAPLTVATEASNVLAAQIREGAPADVFVSADTLRPAELAAAGLTVGQPVPFARNRLALVAPLDDDAVSTAQDLARPGVRVVGTSPGAPITAYARSLVERLAQDAADPQRFLAAVLGNIVSREDNVRAALAKVELGEGDVAFVYHTDAVGSDAVREVKLPPDVETTAEYAAVQVSDRPLAAAFVAWLAGPSATDVLGAAGFEAVP